MYFVQIGNAMEAPCPWSIVSKWMSRSSPPTQQPDTSEGVKPINQPSELLLVVPVLPPISAVMPYNRRTRPPVPSLITARSITNILYALDSLITSSIWGVKLASTFPSLSSIRVTNNGAVRIPLLANAVYALTISPTDISQGPRLNDTTGSICLFSTPNEWIRRTNW